jgi:hypothetical protein
MAKFRVWVWRFAMLAGLVTVGFFAVMTFAPFEPPGEPVLGRILSRTRIFDQGGFFLVQIAGVLLWILTALTSGAWGRGLKAFFAGLTLFFGLIAMASEFHSLVENNALRDALDVARHKLMVSQWITLGFGAAQPGFWLLGAAKVRACHSAFAVIVWGKKVLVYATHPNR